MAKPAHSLRVLSDEHQKRKARPPAVDPETAAAERAQLLELVTHLQRVAQTGLITSSLAHDVDNHVQAITGASFLALRSKDPEIWKRALEKVQERCCALTETTRSFLGFVRRRETVGQTSFLASGVLDETLRLTKPLAHGRGVTVTPMVSEDAQVSGERRLAIQAVVNLVSNAIQACAEGEGSVTITASCPAPDTCRIRVSDNGPGIPEDMRRRLFRPFTTGESNLGGNGLGLFIVRRTVRELDGQIKVSTSSEGTTFQIDLPRHA